MAGPIDDAVNYLISGKLLKELLKKPRIKGVQGEVEVNQLADGSWSVGLAKARGYIFEVDEAGATSHFLIDGERVE